MDGTVPADLLQRWNIETIGLIADTPSSRVWRGRTDKDHNVIVKILKPRGSDERIGMDYLAWRQGDGAVRLLDHEGDAFLLEDGGEITLEDHLARHGEDVANSVFTTLVQRLHAPSPLPVPASLTPLAAQFRSLIEIADGTSPSSLLWARDLARRVLAEQDNILPLHGDLHHGNVVSADLVEWRAIDPKGLVGDRAYEVANIFGNPLGRPDLVLDPDRILGLADRFSAEIGCSAAKILAFAAAHAGLSAIWSLDNPADDADAGHAAGRLAFLDVIRPMIAERYVV